MRTVGVDLSAELKDTWMATIEWTAAGACLESLEKSVSDSEIVAAALEADKTGIDCPFGWPELFFEFIGQHRSGAVKPQEGLGKSWREKLAYRTTDLAIKERWKDSSILSVSSDKLGRVAIRCAALLADLQSAGVEVDRSGMTGSVVEIYPAASLRVWGRPYSGYKKDKDVLSELVDDLLTHAPWLGLGRWRHECAETHDAFDAVIASLSARAVAIGLATGPIADQMADAKVEGWIRLPLDGSLPGLVTDATRR
jgi:predicted nuclease with RNAse H fold